MEKNTVKPFRSVMWDLDGVLLDSESLHIRAELETFKEIGLKVSEGIAKEYLGVKLDEYFIDILRRFNASTSFEKVLHSHYERLKKYYKEVFPLNREAISVLKSLYREYILILVTNRERELVDIVIDRFNLRHFFKFVITSDDVVKSKPDPTPYLTACKWLGIQPNKGVAVEDSLAGIISAKDAGLVVIGLIGDHNRSEDLSKADFLVERLSEVPGILRKIEEAKV